MALSFKFAKSREKSVLAPAAVLDDARPVEESAVEHIQGDFVAARTKERAEALVIPLISKNRWRLEQLREKDPVKAELVEIEESELEKAAKAALVKEAMEEGGEVPSTSSIPLLYANQVPAGFETDDKLDVDLRPEEPDEADYANVPIEDYGMAMLRGMGWKEGEGIGLTHKGVVQQKIPELRPKGLGLGADKALVVALKRTKTAGAALLKENGKNELTLRKGAYIKVTGRGPNKGAYGKVSSFDEDNSRVMVKLALGGSTASVSMIGVQVVDQKEYDKESKCINKSKYDSYKAAQAAEHASHQVEEDPLLIQGDFSTNASNGRKKEKRKRDKSPPQESKKLPSTPWLRSDLRVRIVDESHKYHLQKVRIVDVVSEACCTCTTQDGKLLEEMSESQLETVIPRGDPPLLVMVVRGKHKGEVGEMFEKDKRRCVATIQLTRRKEKLIKADFDDICEFVGDLGAYES